MSVLLTELVAYTNRLLDINAFNDYCPNGLQVQGRPEISRIVTGVTACEALIDAAIEQGADALLVHHGYFWKGEDPCVTGMKARRLRKLLENQISLLAYHLPLDAHQELGNNAQLARILGLEITGRLDDSRNPVGLVGCLPQPQTLHVWAGHVESCLGRKPLLIGSQDTIVCKIGWCTGAAQSYIEKAVALEVDCFMSGEVSEQTVHVVRETGVAYLACGHHATERYGIQALGNHLASRFGVVCQFIDIDNPV